MTNDQLAGILTKALNTRVDVKKAKVTADRLPGSSKATLLVDVERRTDQLKIQREVRVAACLDGRKVGELLEEWLGPTPKAPANEDVAMVLDRQRLLDQTPEQILAGGRSKPPRIPAGKFDWSKPRKTLENPEGTLAAGVPDPAPANIQNDDTETLGAAAPRMNRLEDEHFYLDAETDTMRPVLTRDQMVAAGMDKAARHDQYKRQHGKHPADS